MGLRSRVRSNMQFNRRLPLSRTRFRDKQCHSDRGLFIRWKPYTWQRHLKSKISNILRPRTWFVAYLGKSRNSFVWAMKLDQVKVGALDHTNKNANQSIFSKLQWIQFNRSRLSAREIQRFRRRTSPRGEFEQPEAPLAEVGGLVRTSARVL